MEVEEGVLVKKQEELADLFEKVHQAVKEMGITRKEVEEEVVRQKLKTLAEFRRLEARQRRK